MAYGLFEKIPYSDSAYTETQLTGMRPLTTEEQTAYDAARSRARNAGVPDVTDESGYITDRTTGKTSRKWDALDLTDAERKWSDANSTESIDRIRSRGSSADQDALRLRIMYEYAKTGAKDARNVDDIRKLAWQVRRNRDIATAREVAKEYSDTLGRPVDWRDVYVPTTVPMLSRESPMVEFTPQSVNGSYSGMGGRTLTRAEAIAREINTAMKGSNYSDPTMFYRAEYLAKRFGLAPETRTGTVNGTGRTKTGRTMMYRAMTPEERRAVGSYVSYDRIVDDSVRTSARHIVEQTGMPWDAAVQMARDSIAPGMADASVAGESWNDYDNARRQRESAARRRRTTELRDALSLSPMAKALGLYNPELERTVVWRTR